MMVLGGIADLGLQPVVGFGQPAHVRLHLRDLAAVPGKIDLAIVLLEQGGVDLVAQPLRRLHVDIRAFRLAAGALQQAAPRGLAGAIPARDAVGQPECPLEIMDLRRPQWLLRLEILFVPGAFAIAPDSPQRFPVDQILRFPDPDPGSVVEAPERFAGAGQIIRPVRSRADRRIPDRRIHQLPQANRRIVRLAGRCGGIRRQAPGRQGQRHNHRQR